jgi:hypothetical protein
VLLYYPLRAWKGWVTSFFEANPKAWRDKEETDALIRAKNCRVSQPDQGICLGVPDALVSRLGNLQALDVLQTSVMLNVPPEMTSSSVGSRLGVSLVIHGIQESEG